MRISGFDPPSFRFTPSVRCHRLLLLLIALALLGAGVTGCATTQPAAPATPASTAQAARPAPAPPAPAAPARPPPNFAPPPTHYDPLFGAGTPLIGSDRLKMQALCCPEHEQAVRAYDPLID